MAGIRLWGAFKVLAVANTAPQNCCQGQLENIKIGWAATLRYPECQGLTLTYSIHFNPIPIHNTFEVKLQDSPSLLAVINRGCPTMCWGAQTPVQL